MKIWNFEIEQTEDGPIGSFNYEWEGRTHIWEPAYINDEDDTVDFMVLSPNPWKGEQEKSETFPDDLDMFGTELQVLAFIMKQFPDAYAVEYFECNTWELHVNGIKIKNFRDYAEKKQEKA